MKKPGFVALSLALQSWFLLHPCLADWPMWGRDAQRSGYTPESLPEALELQWVLELPKPRPAWGGAQERLRFDHQYEPILHEGKLFVPSMASDRMSCHDAGTGAELWRFYVDGPVRFAAAAWEGRIYFVSDDGHLYCLDAKRGALLWRFRGGPSDRFLIGNERLISAWPARGGPVIRDGIVYFSASIWPLDGIFVHAVDARSGERVWTNGALGSRFTVQQHQSPAFAGIAPQGYLAATEKHLVVSGGRTVPAVLDRSTGDLIHFRLDSRSMGSKGTGGYGLLAGDEFFIVGGGYFRMDDGEFVASTRASVLGKGELVGADGKNIVGFEPRAAKVESTDRRGQVTSRTVIPERWKGPVSLALDRVFIQCGDRIYGRSGGKTIVSIDVPVPEVGAAASWSASLPDVAQSMMAGDGRLYVSTDAGRIYCFGAGERSLALPGPSAEVLVRKGSEWKYQGGVLEPDPAWWTAAYDDGGWRSGPAPLGYGDERIATKLDVDEKAPNRPVTSYFRRAFEVPERLVAGSFEIRMLVDDGAAVFLNDREVGRLFLPEDEVSASTFAEEGTDSRSYYSIKVPRTAFVSGDNTVAVEVHQRSATSSDVLFDLELLVTPPEPQPRWAEGSDAWTERARRVLELSGSREGYGLVIGLGSGRLAEEMARQSSLRLVVVDPRPREVDEFRRRMDGIGAYGTRVAAIVSSIDELDLPAYFAELVAAENLDAVGAGAVNALVERAFHCLRPYSGRAVLPLSPDAYKVATDAKRGPRLDGAAWAQEGDLAVLSRLAPPTGSADWTHQNADAANSLVSRDAVVKAPFQVLWFGGPSNAGVLPRHGHGPAPQVVGGRLFIEGRDMLRATDIYTGRLLWQRELPDVGKHYDYTSHEPGANAIGGNYVSLLDGVYIVHNDKCLRLDPATGATLSAFILPAADGKAATRSWGFLAVRDDALIAGGWPTDFESAEFTEQSLASLSGFSLRVAVGSIRALKDFQALPYEKALEIYPLRKTEGEWRDEDDETDGDAAADSGAAAQAGGGWQSRFWDGGVADAEWAAHSEDEHRAYVLANFNQLLFEDDMVAKIPEFVPPGPGGSGGRGGPGAERGGGDGGGQSGGTGAPSGESSSEARKEAPSPGGLERPADEQEGGAGGEQKREGAGTEKGEGAGAAQSAPTGGGANAETGTGAKAQAGGQQGSAGAAEQGAGRSFGGRGRGGGGRGRWRMPAMEEISKKLRAYLAEPGSQANDRRALELKREVLQRRYRLPAYGEAQPGQFGSIRNTGSRILYALDRHTGEVKWEHRARERFRHSSIAVGRSLVYAIDRMPPEESASYRRRGFEVDKDAAVVAIDLLTGEVRWRSTARVFGTWLGYSEEHGVLLQAGAHGPDRPKDEARGGLVAYRGSTGEVLWESGAKYSGPCLLLGRRVITQGYGEPGMAMDLLTGERLRSEHPLSSQLVDWGYTRKYGCNTAIGSLNLLTFRSAAAGYYDLLADCGTSNLGGIRSGCTSNLIPAGGILNAPDYTRTCTCSYQNQVSAAFIHSPGGARWSFSPHALPPTVVERLGLNFGAPGDHPGPDGTLWLDVPSVGGESPDVPVELVARQEPFTFKAQHPTWIRGGPLRWVAASSIEGEGEILVHVCPPLEIAVRNEVPGAPPLRAKGAILSSVAPEGGAVAAPVSLGGGFAPGAPFDASVAGTPALASPSATVEAVVRVEGDGVLLDLGDTGRKRQGLSVAWSKLRVRYYVALPPAAEKAASGEGDRGGAGVGPFGGLFGRGGSGRRPRNREQLTVESEVSAPRGRWFHLAFTYDAALGRGDLYLDGQRVARREGAKDRPLRWDEPEPQLMLGNLKRGNVRYSEVRMCSRALDPGEFLIGGGKAVESGAVAGHWRVASVERPEATPQTYTVRLVFSELESLGAGERVFDVKLQGKTVLEGFDIVEAAGGPRRSLTREFGSVSISDVLRIELCGGRGGKRPLLSGVQLLRD